MAYGDLLAVGNRTGVIYSYDGSWTPLTDTPRPESANTVVHGIVVNHKTDDIVITRHYNPSLSVAQRQFCSWNGSSWTLGNANLGNRYSDAARLLIAAAYDVFHLAGSGDNDQNLYYHINYGDPLFDNSYFRSHGWHLYTTTPADIGAIVGLSVNSGGDVFVVGETSRKVHCYRGSGWTVHIDKLPAKKAKEILGLAVKEDGTTYISSVESDRIFVFNPGAVNWENLGVGPDKDITGLAIDTRGSKSTRDYVGIAETVETVNVVEVGVDEAFGVDEGQRRIAAAHIPVSTAETTGLKEDLDHGIDAASTKTEAFGLADTIVTGKLITASVDEQFGVAHKSTVAPGTHVDDALGLLEAADLRGALSLPLTETLDWSDARPVVGRLLGVNLNERLGRKAPLSTAFM